MKRNWPIFILIAAIALSMGRIVFNEFTVWDDPHTITENPSFNPPTLANVLHYWSHEAAGLYVPVTYTAWGLLAVIGRSSSGMMSAWPFHLASVCAHIVTSCLVFLIIRRLIGAQYQWAALGGAMVFALHPVQVEAIAWAAGLKDALAGMFAMAALFLNLGALENMVATSRRWLRIGALIALCLAVLSKPSAVTIIPIAAIIELISLRRSPQQIIRSLWPAVLLAIPALLIARQVQTVNITYNFAILDRFVVAGDAISFYASKLAWPTNLALDYGHSPRNVFKSGRTLAVWLPLLLAIVIVVWQFALNRNRNVLAPVLIFLAGISLNLGFAPFQFQFYSTVADHYLYISMLGVGLLVATLLQNVNVTPCIAIIAALSIALGVQTFRQAGYWHDNIALYTRALSVNSESPGNHNNLGRVLGERGERGDLEAAVGHFHEVLRLDPTDNDARRNLALVEFKRGNVDEALRWLANDPQELVRQLAMRNRWTEVVQQLQIAHEREPGNAEIYDLLMSAKMKAAATQPAVSQPSNTQK